MATRISAADRATKYRPTIRESDGASASPRITETVALQPADPCPPAHNIDPSLVSLLVTSAAWGRRLRSRIEQVGLTWSEYNALLALAESDEPLTVSDLTVRLVGRRGTIAAVVDSLEARALVEWVVDATARRPDAVQLTPEGRARQASAATVVDEVSAEFGAALPAPDLALLHRIASSLARTSP